MNTVVTAAQNRSTPAILTGSCESAAGTQATFLFGLGSATPDCVTSTSSQGMPTPSAGSLKNLTFKAESSDSSTQVTVTVYVNGMATALTCTSQPVSAGGPATCSDGSHSVTISSGDEVGVGINSIGGAVVHHVRAALEKE